MWLVTALIPLYGAAAAFTKPFQIKKQTRIVTGVTILRDD